MLWITAAWVSDEADVFLWKAREKDSAMTCFSSGSAARVYPQECKTCTGRCTTVHRSWASSVPQCTPLPVSHTGPVCPVRLLTKGTCLPVQKRKHVAPRETHTDQHSQESSGAAQTGTTHYTHYTAQQHRKWAICSTGVLYIPPPTVREYLASAVLDDRAYSSL